MNHTLPAKSLAASIVVASLVALLIGCDEGPSQPPPDTNITPEVQYCDSAGANLAGKDLRNLNLQDCTFAGANLSGTNLSGANLRGADLSLARFHGANLSNTNLSGANLSNASLNDASSSGLPAANLNGTNLSGVDLSGADLSGVDLSGVRGCPAHIGYEDRFPDCEDNPTPDPRIEGTWRLTHGTLLGAVPQGYNYYLIVSSSHIRIIYTQNGVCYQRFEAGRGRTWPVLEGSLLERIVLSSSGELLVTVVITDQTELMTFSSISELPASVTASLDGCPGPQTKPDPEPDPTPDPPDTSPRFTGAVADQDYAVGEPIGTLVLPVASGGDGTLAYTLVPVVAGLTFDPATRTITGSPTAAPGAYLMSYTVRDEDGDADIVTFSITIEAADEPTPDPGPTPLPGADLPCMDRDSAAAVGDCIAQCLTITPKRIFHSKAHFYQIRCQHT